MQAESPVEQKVAGTPAYMAPEQWTKETVSGATDVWALGVILHELIAGARPYQTEKTILALENRILALEARNGEIETERAELQGKIADAREEKDREARVQKEMAETLARLRIRTVQLEQELFHVKQELLEALPEVPVEKGADE